MGGSPLAAVLGDARACLLVEGMVQVKAWRQKGCLWVGIAGPVRGLRVLASSFEAELAAVGT